jgi:hypothetical protein
MSLSRLPVTPGFDTDNVSDSYIAELRGVATPEELLAFTARWAPLYSLSRARPFDRKAKDAKRFRVTQKNQQRLLAGDFDAVEALECIKQSRKREDREDNTCKHARMYSCVGMHIMTPSVLIDAFLVARRYGVSTDLALVQMHGGVAALEADSR